MKTEQNNVGHEISRWLHVGIVTLATLGPLISALVSWMRERAQVLQDLKGQGDALVERGTRLSQDLVERGNRVTHEATKRGRAATQDLAARGGQVAESLKEQPVFFWGTFGLGLLIAAVGTYLVVRNRLQR